MRTALLTLLLAVAALPGAGPPDAPATLQTHAWQALGHLLTVPTEQRCHYRYVSFAAMPSPDLRTWQRVQVWWHNQLSLEQAVAFPTPVPGSRGLLWAIDLRDTRWNARAWRVVALREPYTREPMIPRKVAVSLREMVGAEREPDEDGTVAVVVMIWGAWLLRESIELDRPLPSDTYLDLLFAEQRFPKGGKYNDFPKDVDEWETFFGVRKITEELAKQKLDTRVGAVVAGSRDSPRGSFVAGQNRAVQIAQGFWGPAFRTFDARRTAGDTDYLEKADGVAIGRIKFDAGELLAALPNGGQAGHLIDANGKRQRKADGTFVRPRGPDKHYLDVRTMMSCVGCHATSGGFIQTNDLINERLRKGIKITFKDKETELRFKAFFERWESKIEGWRAPYNQLIKDATGWPDDKPLTPAVLVKEFLRYRDWYDAPVTPAQAAAELGVDLVEFRVAMLLKVEDVRLVELKHDDARKAVIYQEVRVPVLGLARLVDLGTGEAIPRDSWEGGAYRDAAVKWMIYQAAKKEKVR